MLQSTAVSSAEGDSGDSGCHHSSLIYHDVCLSIKSQCTTHEPHEVVNVQSREPTLEDRDGLLLTDDHVINDTQAGHPLAPFGLGSGNVLCLQA